MEVLSVDLVVIGGGTSGCIAGYEASKHGLEVAILEKSLIDRSGCLAPGVNAIYSYLHEEEKPEDFVRWLRFQGMGILREDLALSMIVETPYAVSVLETYGLYVEKDRGKPVKQGRWGLRIRGENIKQILSKIARENVQHIFEKYIVVDLIKNDDGIAGAVAFNVETGEILIVYAKATLIATGGASGIYKPYTIPWYPPSNTGSGYAMGIRAGAEMTSFEMRFVPIRIKDINAPIGVTAVGFNAPLINSNDEEFMKTRYGDVGGETAPIPIRLFAPTKEILEGRFPCFIDTRGLTSEQVEKLKFLYLNGWPIFVLFLKARNIDPSKIPLEVQGAEPYITGSHTLPGYWVDISRETTLKRLFAAGDASGGVPLNHVGGALAEGVIAGRNAVKYRNVTLKRDRDLERNIEKRIFFPMEGDGIDPISVEKRLQKVMDEYAGGLSRFYMFNRRSLMIAKKEVEKLKKIDMRAETLFELQMLYEVRDKLEVAKTAIEHMLFREETRWVGFQSRVDFPERRDEWDVFVNSKTVNGDIEVFTRPYKRVVS